MVLCLVCYHIAEKMQSRKCACFIIFSVFRFPNIYGNHMVLRQTQRRATIWGFCEVGEEVQQLLPGRYTAF